MPFENTKSDEKPCNCKNQAYSCGKRSCSKSYNFQGTCDRGRCRESGSNSQCCKTKPGLNREQVTDSGRICSSTGCTTCECLRGGIGCVKRCNKNQCIQASGKSCNDNRTSGNANRCCVGESNSDSCCVGQSNKRNMSTTKKIECCEKQCVCIETEEENCICVLDNKKYVNERADNCCCNVSNKKVEAIKVLKKRCSKDGCVCIETNGKDCICVCKTQNGTIVRCEDCFCSDLVKNVTRSNINKKCNKCKCVCVQVDESNCICVRNDEADDEAIKCCCTRIIKSGNTSSSGNKICSKKGCVCIETNGKDCICLCTNDEGEIVRCDDCFCTNCTKNVKSASKFNTADYKQCSKSECFCIQADGQNCVCVCTNENGDIVRCYDCFCTQFDKEGCLCKCNNMKPVSNSKKICSKNGCVCIESNGKDCICVCKAQDGTIVRCDECVCCGPDKNDTSSNVNKKCNKCKCVCLQVDEENCICVRSHKSSDEVTKSCCTGKNKRGTISAGNINCSKKGCVCIETNGKDCICLCINDEGEIVRCDDCFCTDEQSVKDIKYVDKCCTTDHKQCSKRECVCIETDDGNCVCVCNKETGDIRCFDCNCTGKNNSFNRCVCNGHCCKNNCSGIESNSKRCICKDKGEPAEMKHCSPCYSNEERKISRCVCKRGCTENYENHKKKDIGCACNH